LVKSFSVPLYVQPSITQVSQLSGKRVGVTRFGSVSHFTAKAILDRSNVTDAVVVQTGGYPETMTALTTQAIAGAVISPPPNVLVPAKGLSRAGKHQTNPRYEHSLHRAGHRRAPRLRREKPRPGETFHRSCVRRS